MAFVDDRPSRSRVTLTEVAGRAGVSRSTVSLVLRGSPLVAAETRDRVRAAIGELGYIYNRGAANLRASRTHTVGLLVCEINNPFFAELTAGVDDVLDAAGWVAFLANTAESPERQDRFLQRMREHNVDGVILCPAAGSQPEILDRLRAWRLPCVQALRFVSAREGDYAGVDYEFGMEMVAEHLIRLGHGRIAFVGGNLAHSATRARRAGFAAAMRRHGLSPDLVVRCPLDRRAGAEAIGALLDRVDPPTAVVCFNDVVAFGVLLGLEARGLKAGRDIAVTGFDDVPEAGLSRPALTTVATSPRQIGQEAARLLLRRIADPQGAPERVILPTRLVVRESCGAMTRRVDS
ncbi:MAG TPA: LacI family DNA-binding transcriptional regulator [Azospirillum sp.]